MGGTENFDWHWCYISFLVRVYRSYVRGCRWSREFFIVVQFVVSLLKHFISNCCLSKKIIHNEVNVLQKIVRNAMGRDGKLTVTQVKRCQISNESDTNRYARLMTIHYR